MKTVSAVTRALCPMLLWRKGVSDGTSLSRFFLSLTSGSTHVGLTYDTCYHHRLVDSVVTSMNVIHGVLSDVYFPPKVYRTFPWPCKTMVRSSENPRVAGEKQPVLRTWGSWRKAAEVLQAGELDFYYHLTSPASSISTAWDFHNYSCAWLH